MDEALTVDWILYNKIENIKSEIIAPNSNADSFALNRSHLRKNTAANKHWLCLSGNLHCNRCWLSLLSQNIDSN